MKYSLPLDLNYQYAWFAYLNGHSDNLVNKKTIQKEAAFYFIFFSGC